MNTVQYKQSGLVYSTIHWLLYGVWLHLSLYEVKAFLCYRQRTALSGTITFPVKWITLSFEWYKCYSTARYIPLDNCTCLVYSH